MEKSAMQAAEAEQGDADMRARQASHGGASVSPFASFKVCNSLPWCLEDPGNFTPIFPCSPRTKCIVLADAIVCMDQHSYVLT